MKNKLCIIMVMCIIISATSIGHAVPNYSYNEAEETYSYKEIKNMPGSKIVNEFDAISKLGEEDSYEFKKLLSETSKESEITLKNQGINTERIKLIKSLENISPEKITDEQARLASANMSFLLLKNYLTTSEASVRCLWAWDSAPLNAYDDILAFAWTQGFIINLSKSRMTVDYEDIYGNYIHHKVFSPKGKINGCSFIFGQSYYSPNLRGISSGNATVVMDNKEKKNYLEVVSEYGHTYLGISPGFDITGGLSISFYFGTTSQGDDYVQFN